MRIGNVLIENDVVLAPMAGVTDMAFRRICKQFDVGLVVTEMVSVNALYYKDKKTKRLMAIDESEGPVSLQVFTADPDRLKAVMPELNAHPSLILDINMGCPAPKIVNNGEGSALMKTPELAEKIVKTAVKYATKPVTVKIRKGWDETSVNAVEYAKRMEAAGASALAIHGRTRSQQYAGHADWQIIGEVKSALDIPVIGNGDVFSIEDAVALKNQTQVDGIMIGRGVQGNPWLLQQVATYLKTGEIISNPTLSEKKRVVLQHFEGLRALKGDHIGVLEMRKHAAWYFKGMKRASYYKNLINRANTTEDVLDILIEAFS